MKRALSLIGLAGLFVVLNGCRNPFLPASDVFISYLYGPNEAGEVSVYSAESGGTMFSISNYRSFAAFVVRNKVGINITSLTMVYTDMAGNQVTEYSKSGGKSFKMYTRLYPVQSNSEFSAGEGRVTTVDFYPVDRRVITELATVSSNTINCLLVFRGEDDTGHDIRLSASITIKGYGF